LRLKPPVLGSVSSRRWIVFASSPVLSARRFAARPVGAQSILALWAEQDVIVADEFRDGNVPAGSGNRRVVEKALAALPGGIDKIYLRGDSALYEHDLMRWLDDKAIGYAISAGMSPQLTECIAALPQDHWKPDQEEADAIREWAEVNYLASDGVWRRDAVSPSGAPGVRTQRWGVTPDVRYGLIRHMPRSAHSLLRGHLGPQSQRPASP
jgi:hypothetical protein